jgi:RNA recognition motif-containing protein
VSNIHLPKDRISNAHQGFGFCEFLSEEDADYAVKIMNQIKLYGKPIRVNKASYDKKQLDIGANLFIGNLDASVDEQAMYDTFATFGSLAENPKVSNIASERCNRLLCSFSHSRLRATPHPASQRATALSHSTSSRRPTWPLRT